MATKEEEVLYRVEDRVAIITLNKPRRLNAVTRTVARAFTEAVSRAEKSNKVSAIVVTGNGRGFCSGADLKESLAPEASEGMSPGQQTYETLREFYNPMTLSLRNAKKPVIAAVNGGAVGIGASIALACDFRIMAPNSYIMMAFIKIGLVPDGGASYFLVRKLGYSKALEIALSGEPITADQCLRLGLVNEVVSDDSKLLPAALELAAKITLKPLFAVKLTKESMHFAENHFLTESAEYEARLQQFCRDNQDHIEATMAFLDKRKPTFTHESPKMPHGVLVARL